MRWSIVLPYLCALVSFSPLASAIRLLQSSSLNQCMENSNFTASLFNVVFTPDNRTVQLDIDGFSSISGNVTAELIVTAYGFTAVTLEMNPCKMNIAGLCPMQTGQIKVNPPLTVAQDVVDRIPGIAYSVPDLDGKVRIYINSTDTGATIACLEANMSNAQTVYQKGVEWTVAIIAGLGLVASAITSGLGHSNTAAHVAANALSLFGFFQAQAMIGATSVQMPPIVQAWTQNFQWSIGIIHVSFIQTIATWYQRATGGTASSLLSSLSTTSVEVQKRWFEDPIGLTRRGLDWLSKRDDSTNVAKSDTIVINGLTRVGFKANIEVTNIFLTGLIWFSVFVCLVMIGVSAFKGICELLVKNGKMSSDKFQDFRNGWKVVLRGILFRLILIGWAQMCVLCLWELTTRDSAAEVVLAVVMFFSMLGVLGWASFKVISLARRSVTMHKNPAYILYSDPSCLNKWGFLYVQYRATAYYFVIPVLLYLLIKGMFIGFGQGKPVLQAVALLIVEAAFLVGVMVLRPWMDKKTNIFNISIAAVNFLNAIFLLVFSNVFNQPGMVTGVMGVIFFVINVVFALVLLILVLIASIYAIVSKNPDMRYQPMRDDRNSFIKSSTALNTELDALGNTARGGEMELKSTAYHPTYEDEPNSFSGGNGASINTRPQYDGHRAPPSPVDPSVPLFPSHGPPPSYEPYSHDLGRTASPARVGDFDPASALAAHNFRQQNNSSPWQRGAGYDH
ncbi:DUF907 domain protein [Talaromyces proteolyticus]|uniref:DUF907 domain protein n=1 Tax=Talaromyces proteolyticus TaxID=1131652 RepID=A0AAD4Q3R0_9EURO|nr:DUF907 domain protein [Talaromyces proteolyticus]KAH8702053.1 DUF907 domain protein [Talaromyces proteolyticus]